MTKSDKRKNDELFLLAVSSLNRVIVVLAIIHSILSLLFIRIINLENRIVITTIALLGLLYFSLKVKSKNSNETKH